MSIRALAKLEKERVKLWALEYLAAPDKAKHGDPVAYLEHAAAELDFDRWRGGSVPGALKELAADGLVEVGGSHPGNKNIRKAYRITQKGRDHLAEAANKAPPVGEPEQRRKPGDWTTRVTDSPLEQGIAAFLGELPEFRDSGTGRIRQISRALGAMAESASRTR